MKRNYHSNMSFLDLLFNTLLCFAALFVLSFVLINPSKDEKNVEAKAEYIITVTWDKDLDTDVDTYVEDPAGNLVAFMRREEGLMHLERDDLGKRNDIIQTELGPVEYNENREIVVLRGIIQGEYVVDVHLFKAHTDVISTPIVVQLDRINPSVSTKAIKRITLTHEGHEITAFRFILDADGEIEEINTLPKKLVKSGVPL